MNIYFSWYLVNERDGKLNECLIEDIKGVVGVIFIVGGNIIWFIIIVCILNLILYFEIQVIVCIEIEEVVGLDENGDLNCLFIFDDWVKFIWFECIIQEVICWMLLFLLGVFYVILVDDVYNGYCIFVGFVVYVNVWVMFCDEVVYFLLDSFVFE